MTFGPEDDRELYNLLEDLALAADTRQWEQPDGSYKVTSRNVRSLIKLAEKHDRIALAESLTIMFDVAPRATRNPSMGKHPDLFEKGETRVFVPLSDLSVEQVMKLPRDAFDDDEWDELDEGVQEYIRQSDPVSVERREELLDALKRAADYVLEPDMETAMSYVESGIESTLQYYSAQDLARMAKEANEDEYAKIVDEFAGVYSEVVAGVPEPIGDGQIEDAIGEVLADYNCYRWELEDRDEYSLSSGAMLGEPVEIGFWFQDLPDSTPSMHRDELESVVEEFNSEGDYSHIGLEVEHIEKLIAGGYNEPISIDVEAAKEVVGYPRWDYIEDAVREHLDDLYVASEEDEEEATPPEERVALEFDDGFYVQELQSGELADEGKRMGMCVGDRDMGYIDAVRRGSTKIYSLRTKAGRPKITFEVRMRNGEPVEVKQAKGKANRLPGWDRGKEGVGKMKEDEVAKSIAFVHSLGIDPNDVYDLGPALQAMGEPGTKYEQVESIMEEIGLPRRPRRNPDSRRIRRSFDQPWRP